MNDIKHSLAASRKFMMPVNLRLMLTSIFGASASLLAGCGGDGAQIEPLGGQFFSGTGGTAVYTLVTETGHGFLIDGPGNFLFSFALDTPPSTPEPANTLALSGSITQYNETTGALISSGTAQVSLQRGTSIALTYTLASGKTGSYNLPYVSYPYEQPSSLAIVAGSYSAASANAATGASQIASLTIDSTGNLTGSDNAGCSYTGTITVVNPIYNAYQLNGITETCSSSTITGLAGQAIITPLIYRPGGSTAPQLTLSISNGMQQSSVDLAKNNPPASN
jgi:hypothetical protein